MRSTRILFALGVICALLAAMILTGPLNMLGAPPWLVALVVAGVGILTIGLGARQRQDGEGSAWGLVPSWQYTGRHVESGGLTRDEQERALKEIQEQAEREERN